MREIDTGSSASSNEESCPEVAKANRELIERGEKLAIENGILNGKVMENGSVHPVSRYGYETDIGLVEVDLVGKSHYVKGKKGEPGVDVPTPHVKISPINDKIPQHILEENPNARYNRSRAEVRPATKEDLDEVEKRIKEDLKNKKE